MLTDKIKAAISAKTPFRADRLNTVPIVIALLINIIHWLVILINIRPSSQKILLHFNVISGPDLVAQSFFVYFIPSAALVFLALNFYLARQFYGKEKLSAYFLNFFTIPIQLIFFTATIILVISNA
jgi:hypothetical protein